MAITSYLHGCFAAKFIYLPSLKWNVDSCLLGLTLSTNDKLLVNLRIPISLGRSRCTEWRDSRGKKHNCPITIVGAYPRIKVTMVTALPLGYLWILSDLLGEAVTNISNHLWCGSSQMGSNAATEQYQRMRQDSKLVSTPVWQIYPPGWVFDFTLIWWGLRPLLSLLCPSWVKPVSTIFQRADCNIFKHDVCLMTFYSISRQY